MKFRKKVILVFLVVVLIDILSVNIAFRVFLKPIFINDSKTHMKSYGQEVESVLLKNPENVIALLTSINGEYSIQGYVISESYEILYTEYGKSTRMGEHARRRIVDMIQEYVRTGTDPFILEHYDRDDHQKRLYYIRQAQNGDYIVLCKTIKGMEQDINLVTKFGFIIMFILTVCCVIFWCFLSRNFTRQMEHMSRVTKKMSQLEFDEKVGYRGRDEIGILAESIDILSEQLKKNIDEINKELELKKHFVRTLSHEIKTPITTIKGYAENTQIVAKENEKAFYYSEVIIEECERLNALAGEMLELSSLENKADFYAWDKIETVQLFNCIKMRIAREMPEQTIVIQSEKADICGSMKLLENAVFNFLENAVKYGKNQGTIWLDGYQRKGFYIFSVTNEGEDIPQEEQPFIWDAFYKVDKSRKRQGGYGIGLSLVYQIARLHNGDVKVRSGDGKTTFLFRVPLGGEIDADGEKQKNKLY